MTVESRIHQELKSFGISEGDTLLIHASFNSLVEIPGEAEAFLLGFEQTLTESGTLMIPTFSDHSVGIHNPVFDIRKTPSDLGYISDYFRNREGTKRSLHPTHSVCALGAKADDFVKDHGKDETPFGPNSPFAKLLNHKGKIMMIGTGLRPNASIFAVQEAIAPLQLIGDKVEYDITLEDGSHTTSKLMTYESPENKYHFQKLALLMGEYEMKFGQFLGADTYVINTEVLWERVSKKLKEDPSYFEQPAEELLEV